MGIGIRILPGVRISASSRGIRAGIGPRAARVHVGSGGLGLSTGAGPVTLWTGTGRRRRTTRSSVSSYERQVRATQRAQEIQAVADLDNGLAALLDLHLEAFEPAAKPMAELKSIDRKEIDKRYRSDALHGISLFRRRERADAEAKALKQAEAEFGRQVLEAQRKRDAEQSELDAQWSRLLQNDPDVVLAILEEAFEDNQMPAAAIDCTDGALCVVVSVPAIENVVPDRTCDVTPTGRPTIKTRTKTTKNNLYLGVIASAVAATLKEAFAVAPGLRSSTVVVIEKDDASTQVAPLLVTSVSRQAIAAMPSVRTAALDLLTQEGGVVNARGRTNELHPIDPSKVPGLGDVLEAISRGLGFSTATGPGAEVGEDISDAAGDLEAAVTHHEIPSEDMPVTDVPILGENAVFTIYDAARRQLLTEFASAETPEARFEAICMVSWLHEQLMEELHDAIQQAHELSASEQDRFKAFSDVWIAEAQRQTIPAMENQNALVDRLGRSAAQEIVDQRAQPRLEAIKEQAMEGLRAKVRALGGEVDVHASHADGASDADTKVCPDCAEEVKAAARVCRFCGFRFDAAQAPGS